ncbi:helix-turn-helix transcriptional regulator [Quadrisphaera setariae]|uniref:helix-turn-helix transcriptional regulator n=1 Tax=Quadrisphaera setariae TaxID=2593304 RepID=UPI003F6EC5A6
MSGLPDIRGVGRASARGRSNGVRAARAVLGLTQADLAAAAGVTRQTVVAVEAGDYAPSVYLALAISARLGRSVEELFGQQPEAAGAASAAAGGEQR